ncbi:MAG: hypothetical protein AAEJ65_07545, partial [Planctomycetota bacterium]
GTDLHPFPPSTPATMRSLLCCNAQGIVARSRDGFYREAEQVVSSITIDRADSTRVRLLRWISLSLLALLVVAPGCAAGSAPTSRAASVGVLRAKGEVYRTRSVVTLEQIGRDRGYDLVLLQSLNPRWKGIAIPPGNDIRLPVGKPKIRRIRVRLGGSR